MTRDHGEIEVRPARLEDSTALAQLSSQLGYPVSSSLMSRRLEDILASIEERVFVACRAPNEPIGWVHAAEQRFLEADRRCEILGLVVDEASRRQGIGQRLVAAVEEWAHTRGLTEISVRSNVVRVESHPFYERLGYGRTKTQHVYRKRLSSPRSAKQDAGARVTDLDSRTASWTLRRLRPGDAATYQALRLEGFTKHPLQFRVAQEDECDLTLETVGQRLEHAFVVGGFDAEGLAGVGGLTRYDGAKLQHRALLWGMYVRERARGRGLADELVRALLAEARSQGIRQVLLTVAADNARARRLYERHGFLAYGVEPGAINVDDQYLDEALMIRVLDHVAVGGPTRAR